MTYLITFPCPNINTKSQTMLFAIYFSFHVTNPVKKVLVLYSTSVPDICAIKSYMFSNSVSKYLFISYCLYFPLMSLMWFPVRLFTFWAARAGITTTQERHTLSSCQEPHQLFKTIPVLDPTKLNKFLFKEYLFSCSSGINLCKSAT